MIKRCKSSVNNKILPVFEVNNIALLSDLQRLRYYNSVGSWFREECTTWERISPSQGIYNRTSCERGIESGRVLCTMVNCLAINASHYVIELKLELLSLVHMECGCECRECGAGQGLSLSVLSAGFDCAHRLCDPLSLYFTHYIV